MAAESVIFIASLRAELLLDIARGYHEVLMPRWVLSCAECNAEFTHTEIAGIQTSSFDLFTGLLAKPEFPVEGLQLECPNCKKRSLYQRYQLVLRSN